MNPERGALVSGSDRPYGRRVHTMAGDIWYALARRMIKNNWSLVCRKQMPKFANPSRKATNRFVSCLGEERRMPPSSSRPLDHRSPDIFEVVMYIRWPCPTPSGLAVGGVYVPIKGLSSHELIFISVLTNCAACSRVKKKKKKHYVLLFPTAVVRGYLAVS